MDQAKFQKELFEEWNKNFFSKHSENWNCVHFNKLNDIRNANKLYDFFYPLGISSNSLTDACIVFKEIDYACEDDGDLSVICAETIDEHFTTKSIVEFCEKNNINPKPINKKLSLKEIFVMQGHHMELDNDRVKQFALMHCRHRTFEKFEAKCFGYDQLDIIHSMVDKYKKLSGFSKLEKSFETFKMYYDLQKQIETELYENLFVKCKE